MKFDDIFQHLDEFGPYQRRLYLFICLPAIISAFHAVISVFLIGTPNHRCAISGLDNDTYAVQSDYHQYLINLTIPPSDDETKTYDQCHVYNINISDSSTLQNPDKIQCTSWVYDRSIFLSTFTEKNFSKSGERTVAKSFNSTYRYIDDVLSLNNPKFGDYVNLVCDDRFKTTHVQMIYFAGVFTGSTVLGLLSDVIGRKKTFLLSILLILVSSMALPWSPDFVTFAILRFFIGMSNIGMFMTGFVIGMELVGPTKRVIAGIVIEYFWVVGVVVLAGIGYWLRDWFYIQIVCSVPTVLFLSYWWIIPESARWLVSKNKFEEARAIVYQAAKVNKTEMPKEMLDMSSIENPPREGVWQIFTSRVLFIRSMIVFFNWCVVSMVFYGLALNSGSLGGDFYLNFFLQGLVELPAYIICQALLNVTGRRVLHCTSMILGGICCICTIFTMLYGDKSLQPVTIALAMLGKVGISAAFAIIYVWSAELYPTVVRNSSMGLCSTSARIGGMVSPYIADLNKVIPGNFGRALPLVIFGGLSVLAGFLAIALPETKGMKLPETMEDGRQFGKKNSKYKIDEDKQQEGDLNFQVKQRKIKNGMTNFAFSTQL